MHIPDSMLQGAICPITAAISVAGIGGAVYFGLQTKDKPAGARFAAITALIFALQMLNFPISDGTSGHLLGGVLASSLLGIPFGILAISLVVTLQALVFSDGGTTVLGANLLNMALLGAGIGGLWRMQAAWVQRIGTYPAIAISAWLSVVVAAFAASIELAWDGQIAFWTVTRAMVGTHAIIGIGEALLTVMCYRLLVTRTVGPMTKMHAVLPLAASVVITLVLSPYASGFPDGLEWVAEQYHFLHTAAPAFVGPLADYVFPYISDAALSTAIAGCIGVLLAFALALITFRLLYRRPHPQTI